MSQEGLDAGKLAATPLDDYSSACPYDELADIDFDELNQF